MQIEPNKYISILDTKRFGLNVAKVDLFPNDINALIDLLKYHEVRLIISKVECENLELINKLETLGFHIKDIQATYKYDLNNHLPPLHIGDSNILLRDPKTRDLEQIENIAFQSFQNYGHYANDSRLDPNKCNEIYRDWAKRSLIEKGVSDKIIIAEINKEIAGFLTFKTYKDEHYYAAGGIGAVDIKFRNNNVFRKIAIAGLHWGKSIGLEWEEHNVLLTNYPVNRSFSKIGFKIYKSFFTMHYWIN